MRHAMWRAVTSANPQCGRPTSVRTPQKAAAPKRTMNAIPVSRPEVGVLPQDWSTAATQTMNSRIAPVPRTFSHIVQPSVIWEMLAGNEVGCRDQHHPGACRERRSDVHLSRLPTRPSDQLNQRAMKIHDRIPRPKGVANRVQESGWDTLRFDVGP